MIIGTKCGLTVKSHSLTTGTIWEGGPRGRSTPGAHQPGGSPSGDSRPRPRGRASSWKARLGTRNSATAGAQRPFL